MLAGAALAGTAVGLASTAQEAAEGVVIPALHDAANDAPIAYTPVCGRAAGVPVCVNPAYGRWLPDVTAALAPMLAEVAGCPARPCGPPRSRRHTPAVAAALRNRSRLAAARQCSACNSA